MIFPVAAICVVACLIATRREPRSGVFLGLIVWGIGVLAAAVPILEFNVDYSFAADAMVGAALVALTTGYLLVRRPTGEAAALDERTCRRLAMGACIVGGVGCVLLLVDAYRAGLDLQPLTAFDRLAEVRQDAFDRLYSEGDQSYFALLGSFTAPVGYLGLIAVVQLNRARGDRSLTLLAVATFLLLAAVGFLIYGGRAIPFYAALLALVAWFLAGGRLRLSRGQTLALVAASIVTLFFSISWIQNREENNVSPEAQLVGLARAEASPWLRGPMRESDAVGAALVSYTYFSANIPSFAFYLQQDAVPGPLDGQYSFPLVYQFGAIGVGETPQPWTEVRSRVFAPLEANGYFGNIWATWLRDLLVDFGYLGALIFCALYGAFIGVVRNAFEQTGAVQYRLLETISVFTFAFGAFTGLLYFTFIAVAFLVAIGLWGARLLLRSPTRLPSRA